MAAGQSTALSVLILACTIGVGAGTAWGQTAVGLSPAPPAAPPPPGPAVPPPPAAPGEAPPPGARPGEPPAPPAVALRRALEAFEYGQHAVTVALLRPLIEEERLSGADLVQALRAYGVSLFLLGRRGGAEAAFLLLLRLDPQARLNPALVPPEAIAFLEDVRARHTEDVRRALHEQRPSPWVNLLPPWGQFQNQHRGKAWALCGLEVGLLALDIASYWVARKMPRPDGTVESESTFSAVKTLNVVAFSLLAGTLVYGIVDGFYFYHTRERMRDRGLHAWAAPIAGGATVGVSASLR